MLTRESKVLAYHLLCIIACIGAGLRTFLVNRMKYIFTENACCMLAVLCALLIMSSLA